ncbi:TnsA-like heteromeric transposase endonuclease subunit [Mycolicibacterium sp. CBMA 226]|uniref:TnsA-like heteromeric transposase endonuclease subunit n=1 Tax=Mycolicibacterium sp. CBMA 226 TaxID=2606611 RepID=UPI0012DE4410|nr:TnsA-like heteromeric transposase endonuclease subunit [Mycolicibacterium sp. CBMA 226]MUL74487.1 TnsA-like heteromeric transposase endonuclease subunit [Mycolicibacterium sp. CBMA 226]
MLPHESPDPDTGAVPGGTDVRPTWTFRIAGSEIGWIWQQNAGPPTRDLEPVRVPRSSKRNRHIPVTAYSVTNGAMLALESGLEHDLMRKLDRDPTVTWLVPQPLRLTWKSPAPIRHTPDLLSIETSGTVTIWDAHTIDDDDDDEDGDADAEDDFEYKAAVTRDACSAVGWRYEVFSGFDTVERLNHLWLYGFRRRPLWSDEFEGAILRLASLPQASLGGLLAADDGSGLMKSVMWHLVWSGALSIDMTARWTDDTAVNTATGGI